MNSFNATSIGHMKKFWHSAVHYCQYLPGMTAVLSLINNRTDIQLTHNTILGRNQRNVTTIITIRQMNTLCNCNKLCTVSYSSKTNNFSAHFFRNTKHSTPWLQSYFFYFPFHCLPFESALVASIWWRWINEICGRVVIV